MNSGHSPVESRKSSREEKKRRGGASARLSALFLFLLFLAPLAVYYHSLFGDFVNIDDLYYIHENEYIRDLSWGGIYRMFTSVIVVNYFPLQILSYALDFALWGMNPFGYRLTNLLFHIGNTYLVFFLFRRILGGTWKPFIGSLVFALHPVNVESVAWISERKNVLSGFFLLLAFLSYIAYLQNAKKRAYGLSLFLYLLSVLAKVSAIVLPLLLILYDLCCTSRPRKEWIKDKIPFVIISAFFSWLAIHVYQFQKIIPDYQGGHPVLSLLTMANVLVEYVRSLILPLYLYFFYQTQAVKSLYEYQLLLSLFFLLLLAGVAAWSYGRMPPLFFAVVWFFLCLLPVMNIVPIGIMRADRYLYLPSIGFALALAWGIPKAFSGSGVAPGRASAFIFALILGSYAVLAVEQCTSWMSTHHLWSRVLTIVADHPKAYKGLGKFASDRGQVDLAILYYREAKFLEPNDPELLNNLADLYVLKGKLGEARELLQKALEKDPDFTDAYVNLGIVYAKWDRDDLASAAFEKAAGNKKTRAQAQNNLGVIYKKRGNLQQAIRCFGEAAQADPTLIPAHLNLALAIRQDGRMDEAIRQLQKALEMNPRSFHLNYHLGKMYLEKNLPHGAAAFLMEALKSKGDDPDAHFRLALAIRMIPGGEEKARFHFQKALGNERNAQAREEMRRDWEKLELKLPKA